MGHSHMPTCLQPPLPSVHEAGEEKLTDGKLLMRRASTRSGLQTDCLNINLLFSRGADVCWAVTATQRHALRRVLWLQRGDVTG